MAEQGKFELGKNKSLNKNGVTFNNPQQHLVNQSKGHKINLDSQQVQRDLQTISDDEFFSQLQLHYQTDFLQGGNNHQGLDKKLDDIQNPQTEAIMDPKISQGMQTMVDNQMEEACQDQITEQFKFIQLQENTQIEEQFDANTPQKFKRILNFQQFQKDQQYNRMFWAPRKNLRKQSQLSQ